MITNAADLNTHPQRYPGAISALATASSWRSTLDPIYSTPLLTAHPKLPTYTKCREFEALPSVRLLEKALFALKRAGDIASRLPADAVVQLWSRRSGIMQRDNLQPVDIFEHKANALLSA